MVSLTPVKTLVKGLMQEKSFTTFKVYKEIKLYAAGRFSKRFSYLNFAKDIAESVIFNIAAASHSIYC